MGAVRMVDHSQDQTNPCWRRCMSGSCARTDTTSAQSYGWLLLRGRKCGAGAAASHLAAAGSQVRFKGHACETNDIFLLAGRALARAIQSWKSNGRDAEAATLPLRCFHGRPWWDAVAAGDSNPELRQQCQQLVADSGAPPLGCLAT